jgi:arginyl-tRNA synthetase
LFKAKTVAAMLDLIRHDLALLGIHHDIFASEAELQASGRVDEGMAVLRGEGLVYEGELERP